MLHNNTGVIPSPELKLPLYSAFRAAATNIAPLPIAPTGFGLNNLLPYGDGAGTWGYMGNNTTGDCVEAAIVHSIMYNTLEATGTPALFVDNDAVSLYTAWTGYNPSTGANNNGTPVALALGKWASPGITDDNGHVHTILATLQLNANDTAEVAEACYVLGAISLVLEIPAEWEVSFGSLQSNNKTWDYVASPTGYISHFATIVGRSTNGNFIVVSWGYLWEMTPAGFIQAVTAAYAFITTDYVNPGTGKSPLGYTMPQLQQYLAAMNEAL